MLAAATPADAPAARKSVCAQAAMPLF